LSFFDELKRRSVFKVAIGYVIIAWLLMQIGDTLGPALRLPEWIPSALAFFLILGFPLAMYLAWVYELTPDGIKTEKPASPLKLDRLIVWVAVLALGYFAFDYFVLNIDDPADDQITTTAESDPVSPANEVSPGFDGIPENSIAVLPFINMSSDPEQEYFSDGLSEELLNLLARIPELQVTSRSSAFAYKGKEINIPEVAKALGVAHILEGSVRKSGNRIRVTAQLIDASRDVHLWSDTYEHSLDDIFSIQDEISAAVVSSLRITLLGEAPKSRKIDPEAMDLNLQARYFWNRRNDGDVERAREYYEKSLAIDSSNAPAWAGLAILYNEQVRSGEITPEQARPLFKQAALNAVDADPNYPEGHIRLAWAYASDGDIESATKHRNIANQIDANNHLVIFDRAVRLKNIGRLDLAIIHFERMAEIDPLSAISQNNLGSFYTDLGRLEEAEVALNRNLELSPNNKNGKLNLARLRILQGRFEAALTITLAIDSGNSKQELLAIIYHALGQVLESQAAFDLIKEGVFYPPQAWQLSVHAYRGELETAFILMQQGLDAQINFTTFLYDPFLRNMHADPRWESMLRNAGWDPEATID